MDGVNLKHENVKSYYIDESRKENAEKCAELCHNLCNKIDEIESRLRWTRSNTLCFYACDV